MNVLYFLGNGFDQALGLKTSYSDFYQWFLKNSDDEDPIIQKIKDQLNDRDKVKLWADFELGLGEFASVFNNFEELQTTHEYLSLKLQEYLLLQQNSFAVDDKKKLNFWNTLENLVNFLDPLEQYSLQRRADIGQQTIDIITFNYTDIVERLLGGRRKLRSVSLVSVRELIHLHGILGDTIVFGVNDSSQINNDVLSQEESVTDYMVKVKSNAGLKNRNTEHCEELIKQADVIVLFGVSLGDTDRVWWKSIGRSLNLNSRQVLIDFEFTQSEEWDPKLKFRKIAKERELRKRLYSQLGIDSAKADIKDQVFVQLDQRLFSKEFHMDVDQN